MKTKYITPVLRVYPIVTNKLLSASVKSDDENEVINRLKIDTDGDAQVDDIYEVW